MLYRALLGLVFLLPLSSAQDNSSTADLSSLLFTNLSDTELAASLTQTNVDDTQNQRQPPHDPHTVRYQDYTLYYEKFKAPYVPVERAQAFLMFCNVLFTNKILKIAFQTKSSTVPVSKWDFLCSSTQKEFEGLSLELWPSSRGRAGTVPLTYIASLMYHMYNFDGKFDVNDPYVLEGESARNGTAATGAGEEVGMGGPTNRGGAGAAVPSFWVELSQTDGPGHVVAWFKKSPGPGYRDGVANGTEGSGSVIGTQTGVVGARQTGGTLEEITAIS